jgi:hypothetical protein
MTSPPPPPGPEFEEEVPPPPPDDEPPAPPREFGIDIDPDEWLAELPRHTPIINEDFS